MISLPLQYLLAVAAPQPSHKLYVVLVPIVMALSLVMHMITERLRRNIRCGTAVPLYRDLFVQTGMNIRAKRKGDPRPLPPAVLEFEATIKQLPFLKRLVRKQLALSNSPDRLPQYRYSDVYASVLVLAGLIWGKFSHQITVVVVIAYSLVMLGISIFFRWRGHRKRVGFE